MYNIGKYMNKTNKALELLLFLHNCRRNWDFCVVVEKHDGAKGAGTWTRFVGDSHMLLDEHTAIKFGLVIRLQSILIFRVDHDRRANNIRQSGYSWTGCRNWYLK